MRSSRLNSTAEERPREVRRHPGTAERVLANHDSGPPHGHVVGHKPGGPPVPPRDPNRPTGRIGPRADVTVYL